MNMIANAVSKQNDWQGSSNPRDKGFVGAFA
jgi:hypothetical protein